MNLFVKWNVRHHHSKNNKGIWISHMKYYYNEQLQIILKQQKEKQSLLDEAVARIRDDVFSIKQCKIN